MFSSYLNRKTSPRFMQNDSRMKDISALRPSFEALIELGILRKEYGAFRFGRPPSSQHIVRWPLNL